MNWRRGLLRLWLTFSLLFAVAVSGISYNRIEEEFKQATVDRIRSDWLPTDCSELRGTEGTDYLNLHLHDGSAPLESMSADELFLALIDAKVGCWYKRARFRMLFPEYRDLADDDLLRRAYAKASMELKQPHQPWKLLGSVVAVAFGVPLVVLGVGSVLYWAFAGFKKDT